jgi:hypothetical protein
MKVREKTTESARVGLLQYARLMAVLAVLACWGTESGAHRLMPPDPLFSQPKPGETLTKDGKRVTELDVAAAVGTKALSRAPRNRPDDSEQPQIKVWYVLPSDGLDEALDTNGAISHSVSAGLNWLRLQSGGRTFRVDTYNGDLDVGFFRMSKTDAQIAATGAYVREEIEAAMGAAGLTQANHLNLVYYGGTSNYACASAAYPPVTLSGTVGALFLKGAIPGYPPCSANALAATGTASPGYWEFAWVHEMMHVLSLVGLCAPHHTLDGHVGDTPIDLMYGGPEPWLPSTLDVNHDDYFDHGRADCNDLMHSAYLDSSPRQSVSLDANQHGLSGSWYEQATAGQGLELEVYPDMNGPGNGYLFASWFTYDYLTNSQRWYTLGGPVRSGQSQASLTIYRNVGGNFDAGPVTTGVPVGTATLTFATCDTAVLTYNFSDGSNRTGSIPLTRLTRNVTCSVDSTRTTNSDFALSGNWYEPASSGQGLFVEVNPMAPALFFAWYTYSPSGQAAGAPGQRWYTGQASYSPGARQIRANLYETNGGAFNAPTPIPHSDTVGFADLVFLTCGSARLTYTFTAGTNAGRSGSIDLSRVGPVPRGCAG